MLYKKDPAVIECIEALKTGDRNRIKEAKKALKKLWNKKIMNRGNERNYVFHEFIDEVEHFDAIKNLSNKIAFIYSLHLVGLGTDGEYFNRLAYFLLKVIQDKNGSLRRSALNTSSYLLFHAEYFFEGNLKHKKSKIVVLNYCKFVDTVHVLLNKYYFPEYRRYKYVETLPPSIYKSLEMLLTIALRGNRARLFYNDYEQTKITEELEKHYDFTANA